MTESLKLVCLNIEHRRHFDTVLPFLKREGADVVCLQEVMEGDLPMLESELEMKGVFAPMLRTRLGKDTSLLEALGIALFSSLAVEDVRRLYYYGSSDITEEFVMYESGLYEGRKSKVVLSAVYMKGGERFVIGTTHFTWSADGQASDLQRSDLKKFFTILEGFPEIVLCGDFNAPRGREIFDAIAARYKDNVPPEYTTSLDGTFHRAGALPYMVDGLFTTPGYRAENVRLVCGVSDHCAIVADIIKNY